MAAAPAGEEVEGAGPSPRRDDQSSAGGGRAAAAEEEEEAGLGAGWMGGGPGVCQGGRPGGLGGAGC